MPDDATAPPSAGPAPARPHGDRGQGRKAFAPTAAQRRVVQVLRGAGLSPEDVAREIGVAPGTLRKHFRDELARGKESVIARIGARLIQKALGGDNTCMIFFLKVHGGPAWRDKQHHEVTGPNGSPLTPPNLVVHFMEPRSPADP